MRRTRPIDIPRAAVVIRSRVARTIREIRRQCRTAEGLTSNVRAGWNGPGRRVRCVDTGDEFDSLGAAMRWLGDAGLSASRTSVRQSCDQGYRIAGKYRFVWADKQQRSVV